MDKVKIGQFIADCRKDKRRRWCHHNGEGGIGMGENLRRTKAELYGIVEKVVKMYEGGMTLEDIEESLREEGYQISRESIRRTLKKNKTIAKELQKAREETAQLIDVIRSKPATDVNEASADFLIAKAFEYVKTIEAMDFEDLPELAKFVKDITKVKTDLVKQRMDYQSLYARARDDFMAQLKTVLYRDNPTLYEKLFELASHMEVPCE